MHTRLIEPGVTGSAAAAWCLPVSATAARCARRHTNWFLDRLPVVGEELAELAVLVVSELVTNAYAASAALARESEIGLSLRLSDDGLLVEVADCSPGTPVRDPWPDATSDTGRGLDLVDAFSREWGYRWQRDQKIVYAVLPVPAGGS
jgi:anti-sigma regulatory factor (Ser/Thr protein kinase)